MKRLLCALLVLANAGCAIKSTSSRLPDQVAHAPSNAPDTESFQAVPSRIDKQIETASIEDYIIALPKFAYHEESEKGFWQRVRTARKRCAENKGKGGDFLFVDGDGCCPSKDFTLNRVTKTLTIRVYNWEEPWEGTITIQTMRWVPGGWMRGPEHNIGKPAQGAAGNAPSPRP